MLKRYASVSDLVRDLYKLRKSVRSIIAADNDDSDDAPVVVKRAIMRQGNKPLPGERFRAQPKIPGTHLKAINSGGKKLTELLQQQQSINHIDQLLRTDFANTNYPKLADMQRIAQRLKRDVARNIEAAKGVLSDLSEKHATEILHKLTNSVHNKLQTEIGKRARNSSIEKLVGLVNGEPQYTNYLIFSDFRNDNGQIFPNKIFALSLLDGKLYLNAVMPNVKPPGQFRIGQEIPIHPKQLAETTNAVMQKIHAQLKNDDYISDKFTAPMPLEKSQINFDTIEHITDYEVRKNDTILVKIKKSVGDVPRATEVVNKIQTYLYSALMLSMPKSTLKITSTTPKLIGANYVATLKFIPGGKWSGQTLDQETTKQLHSMFTPQQVLKIRQMLMEDT